MRPRRRATVAMAGLLALLASSCSQIVTLELPTLAAMEATSDSLTSRIVAPDGTVLAVLRREHREPVALSQLPVHVIDAVLVAEDERFFDHSGVDLRAIVRAALANRAAGRNQQGGSTITQQLVKLRYLPDAERTYDTKLAEALLARELESSRSKSEILEEYLNAVYFGEGAYGIQAAAWTYFRRDVADLDVAQAALLAVIIRAPSSLAPTTAPDGARWRRDDLLYRMARAGAITTDERDAALATPIEVHGREPLPQVVEPHLVDLVIRTLLADPTFGATESERADRLYRGGLTVHTTIDLDLQRAVRDVLTRHLSDPDDPAAAVTVVEPATGRVVAVAGSRAYAELQFDLATQARRQPGSTFKTFVLAAAIQAGYHPEDRLDGTPGVLNTGNGGTWEVRNYDLSDPGDVTLAGATRISVNAAFARLGIDVGIERVANLSRAMGIGSPVPTNEPQITLGGGELGVTTWDMAAAYATLANQGRHVPTTVIDRIEGADGEVVWEPGRTPQPALPADVAYVTTSVLQGVVEGGTGLGARVDGWQVAGKTGTTSDHADAWFVGATTARSAAVWVGHPEGSIPLLDVQGVERVTGGSIPASIFAEVMAIAHDGLVPTPFHLDEEFWVTVEVDPVSGLRAAAWCPGERVRVPRVLAPTRTCAEPPARPTSPPTPTPTPEETIEPPEPTDIDGTDDGLDPDPDADGTTDGHEEPDGDPTVPPEPPDGGDAT